MRKANTFLSLFNQALTMLPDTPERFWSDGDQILCQTAEDLSAIVSFFDALAHNEGLCADLCTGYYDPTEDAKEGLEDTHTGYHYITTN